jgi:two-component system, chemotaxis family, chemotaxis protein CheY
MAFNVLIVDDSLPMRSVIRKTIEISGFQVNQFFEASNGEEALVILNAQWLDLVITDYNMPRMNGLELIEAMKKEELLQSIPVVVITTEGSRQKAEEFLSKGAVGYIQKPFTPEEIKQKLNHLLGEGKDGKGGPDDRGENLDF